MVASTQDKHQQSFEALFSDAPASVEDVAEGLCVLAKWVWFGGFTPNFETVAESELQRAGYFVDFLAQNPLVDKERRKELNSVLMAVMTKVNSMREKTEASEPFFKNDPLPRKNRDDLAVKWHLGRGLPYQKMRMLLDLQRRANIQNLAS